MKKIGIIGAMQIEIELLSKNMKVIEKIEIAGFPFIKGQLFDKEVVLTRCGVGKVNAAACTQILIDRFEVDCIINTGIAGSLHHNVKICDVVISTDVTHHDVRPAQMKNLFPFQETFTANNRLIDLAYHACQSINLNISYHKGRIVSGESFVSDSELKKKLIEDYSPYCVEMEGSSIGHVAFLNDIPFLVIRSISDNADEEASMSYEAFEKIAGDQSASIVMAMVKDF